MKIFRSLVPFFAMSALLTACTPPPPTPAPEPPGAVLQGDQLRYPSGNPQLALLGTVEARPASAVAVDLPARITWNEAKTQRIYAPFAGRVSSINADVGQVVKAGSVLAQMASPDFGQAQADAARAAVDAAFTQKTLARQKELLNAGVSARKDFEQSEADAARAAAELARAKARTNLYGAGSSVNQQLAIKSGINGLIVDRNLNPGQELRPDQSGVGVPPLFVVSDPTSLWVQIDARENDVAGLKVGTEFQLIVPAMPNEKFTGKVVASGDAIDPTTRTIKVRGEVANPNRRLKAEMLATVRLERHLGGGLVVPASAVILRGNQHTVYVESAKGVFAPREIKLSYQDSKQAIILSGIEAGDKVVVENALLLSRQFEVAQENAEPKSDVAPNKSAEKPSASTKTEIKP